MLVPVLVLLHRSLIKEYNGRYINVVKYDMYEYNMTLRCHR